jgi:acetyl esterase/lipase
MLFETSTLLEVYNPSETRLAPRTAAFAAKLAETIPAALSASVSTLTIDSLRESVAQSLAGKALTYPKGLTEDSYIKENIGDMDCYILRAAHPDKVPTLVMFYGGGFCLNTLSAHMSFMANIVISTPCNIILPDYPLAPESKASETLSRSTHFLKALLEEPTTLSLSNNIILMGWSSGAHIALTLALNFQKETPQLFRRISQLLLLSAWMDLSLQVTREGPYQPQQHLDTIAAGADLLEIMAQWYLPEGYEDDELTYCPALRPVDELKTLPPTSVIVGGCDVLLGDSVFIADKLKHAGTPAQFIALEGQTHNYLVFDELSRDGVFVPDLIGRIITGQSIEGIIGEDGFGLSINTFNQVDSAKAV